MAFSSTVGAAVAVSAYLPASTPPSPEVRPAAAPVADGSPSKSTQAPDKTQSGSDAPRPPQKHRRQTYTPNNNGDDTSQGQLTQNRNAIPTRFVVRNKPVPAFANPYPPAARGVGPRAGPYFFSRWAEDWSGLRAGRQGKPDFFDPVKYVPLDGDGDVYLTLSGETRARLNYTTNPRLRKGPDQEQYLVRNVLGADLHLGKHVRLFGDIASANAFGSPGVASSPSQRNDLIVQQLFAEATTMAGGVRLTARVGRQEFMDGPPNLIHIRPAPNVYTSLDGVRLSIDGKRARVSLFDFNAVKLGLGAFDDPTDHDDRFRGVTASFALPQFDLAGAEAKLFFDPFVWNRRVKNRTRGPVAGTDDRNFYGARLWGGIGDGTVDVTVVRQGGQFAGRAISAWGVFANAGYLLSDGPWHPRLGVHLDYASGGGTFGEGKLRGFSFFYGSIPYFSWGNFVGPSNLANASASIRFTPLPRVSVTAEYSHLRRASQDDAIYTFLETPYAGTQRVRGYNVGNQIKADVAWQVNPHTTVSLRADVLFAGKVLKSAGYTTSVFLGPELQFRF